MVMAHVLVQVLEQERPGIEIHVVAPPTTAPLAVRMPGVATVHELAVGHGELGLRRRRQLALSLRGGGFQTAYVLPNSFKSALIPFWAKIPERVGWHGESRYWLLNDRRRLDPERFPRMIDRFMSLGLPRGAISQQYPSERVENAALCATSVHLSRESQQHPSELVENAARQESAHNAAPAAKASQRPVQYPTPGGKQINDEPELPRATPKLVANQENQARVLAALGLNRNRPITVLCPGAEYGGAKRWPPEHFAAVARARLEQGQAVWILGSTADTGSALQIADAAPGVTNLAGRTSLLDAVDLLSLADNVVTNDSGLMHVACALNRRVIAVFGSTSPDFTPPLSNLATVIEQDLECRPCFQRECPLSHLNCLRGIAPERVIAAIGV